MPEGWIPERKRFVGIGSDCMDGFGVAKWRGGARGNAEKSKRRNWERQKGIRQKAEGEFQRKAAAGRRNCGETSKNRNRRNAECGIGGAERGVARVRTGSVILPANSRNRRVLALPEGVVLRAREVFVAEHA